MSIGNRIKQEHPNDNPVRISAQAKPSTHPHKSSFPITVLDRADAVYQPEGTVLTIPCSVEIAA